MPTNIPDEITALDISGKNYTVPIVELRWRPAAYGIVIKDNTVLLSKQFNGYDLPGGGVDLGEMPESAVVREVWEETGMDVTNPRLLDVSSNFFVLSGSHKGNYVQSIMLYYVCDHVGGELSTAGFDEWEKENSEMAEWWPLDKLDELPVGSSVDFRKYIHQAAA